ncbi:MAG: 4Fe-4S binding protein [Odoribacteraceae bacterium]|nr:4Fe-4S binding protein [Odoribacteraceae bacterium]
MVAVVDETKCTGCRRCIRRCRRRAIEPTDSERNVKALVRYPDRCSGCGDCVKSCKFDAMQLVDKIM